MHVATQKLATMRRKRSGRGESPDPEDVWRQFENLLADGHRPTVKTYTSLLSALGDVGAPEDAEEVLARMRDAGEAPDARAYNAAVHAWCANGKPANAERLVEKMFGDGVAPDAATYPDIVAAYAALGDLRRCESIVSRRERVRGRGPRRCDGTRRCTTRSSAGAAIAEPGTTPRRFCRGGTTSSSTWSAWRSGRAGSRARSPRRTA